MVQTVATEDNPGECWGWVTFLCWSLKIILIDWNVATLPSLLFGGGEEEALSEHWVAGVSTSSSVLVKAK